jgi:hypothetical protein
VITTTIIEQTTSNPLAAKVRAAFSRALAGDSALPAPVFAINGMSGRKYRMFVNNLVNSIEDARYLEIGTWMGSTLCSANHGNKVRALTIDNWSQFGGPAAEFFAHLAKFKTPDAQVSFTEADFRSVDFATIGRFNVYLFDGPHRAEDHRDAILNAQPALDRHHVLIIDDWNWPAVRKGTNEAILASGVAIDHLIEIRTSQDETPPPVHGPASDWHNGYFIAAVTKP